MYEYKVVNFDQFVNENKHLNVSDYLNLYGKDRWELVSIHEPKSQPYGTNNRLCESFMVFKRAMAH